ncbi:MAG: endonuclease III domain-containing protein [Ignavibacteriales bacterium]
MKKEINKINSKLLKYFGIPKRKKRLPSPIDTLIATILSQNTNDKNSYQAYQNLKQKYKSVNELSIASRIEIEKLIKVAGLGKQKSAAIKNFLSTLKKWDHKLNLQHIKKIHNDEILNMLTSIKGIGIKTASCVLLFSLDRNVCPVDTHVHRTLNRIGIVKTSTPDKTFENIKHNLPNGIAHQFHTNLIKLGRGFCKPVKPQCTICPLIDDCSFEHKSFEIVTAKSKSNFLLLDSI